ncbi:MAG TPA: hypothetical protein VGB63_13025 [Pedobacter sp.]|jgi:hypothetical protein
MGRINLCLWLIVVDVLVCIPIYFSFGTDAVTVAQLYMVLMAVLLYAGMNIIDRSQEE